MIREYFLGRATSEGFRTHIHELIGKEGYFTYIIKGGPGTGKSSMMRRIAKRLVNGEIYRCSSDPDSLDGVVCTDSKTIIIDGTSPHVVEPTYPGACQRIVNLGDCWNKEKISEHREEIISATKENSTHHMRVRRQLKAIEALTRDIITLEEECLLKDKADGFILREASRVMPKASTDGYIEFRQTKAITPKGVISTDSIRGYERVIIDGGIATVDYLLKGLCREAVSRGYRCLISESPYADGCVYESLTIPELRLTYITDGECSRKINGERFIDKEKMKLRRSRIVFDKGASAQLVKEAISSLRVAKESHDVLEGYYISAMDFDKVKKIGEEIEGEIFG